jgi:4-hydroxy-tetrahydrodipicolinate synthase
VLATPFTAQGGVDAVSLRRLIDFETAAGASALAIFGLASEAFTLSTGERTAILAETVDATRGTDLAVIAGVTPTSLQSARDQLAHAAAGGAHVVMVMPPHLVKPSAQQVVDFFGALSDDAIAAGVEIMVQDAPGATGVQMDVPTLAQCAGFPGVTSIKVEAPPTAPKVRRLAERPELAGVDLLGGQNAQFMLEEFASGAVGTMPACEFTDLLVPIVDDWTAGREDDARDAFDRLLPLIVWGLQPGLGWAVHKEVLVARGIIECAAVRSPAMPLPEFSRGLLERVTVRLPLTRFAGAVAR